MSTISAFSQSLTDLLPTLGSERFSGALVDTVRGLVPVDEASVIVYEKASLPFIEYTDPGAWAQPNLDTFLKSAFLLDPYFIAASREKKSGFFRLRDLAPSGFRRSEYYRVYYKKSRLRDECGYLFPLQGGGFINISLGRISMRAFSKPQLRLLEEIAPLIAVLCRMHWKTDQPYGGPEKNLRGQLETALGCFGASVLTQRERQVTNLILLGHTTKKLAEVLKISPETVKLHRKHVYAKLDIQTQSELFYLFIDSLMSIDGYNSGDPLIAYSQKPATSPAT
ncbi:MAG: helix-turn-helix transcriptional regulator [Gammaproteobacteria bacterium]|nr:helix-turn-helix transcriptional regulator [Gammaproteobacteria bacterium]